MWSMKCVLVLCFPSLAEKISTNNRPFLSPPRFQLILKNAVPTHLIEYMPVACLRIHVLIKSISVRVTFYYEPIFRYSLPFPILNCFVSAAETERGRLPFSRWILIGIGKLFSDCPREFRPRENNSCTGGLSSHAEMNAKNFGIWIKFWAQFVVIGGEWQLIQILCYFCEHPFIYNCPSLMRIIME